MTITTGDRLGADDVIGKLGEGGMGEVWRARNTKLGREVAIGVLPEAFAADAERLERGPLPLDEALGVARQVAKARDALASGSVDVRSSPTMTATATRAGGPSPERP